VLKDLGKRPDLRKEENGDAVHIGMRELYGSNPGRID
jgi:hypothetical protein